MNQNLLAHRLYKCFDKAGLKYARALAACGCARIGTLSEFRDLEDGASSSQLNRADPLEGMSGVKIDYLASPLGGFPDGPDIPEWSKREIQQVCPLGSATSIVNCRILKTVSDMYIYCTSTHLTQALLDRFGSYVVEILNPLRFFDALGTELALTGYEWGKCLVGLVTYERRVVNHEDDHPPPQPNPFRKDPEYQQEREFRSVWVPKVEKRRLGAIVLDKSDASKFCRMLPMKKVRRLILKCPSSTGALGPPRPNSL